MQYVRVLLLGVLSLAALLAIFLTANNNETEIALADPGSICEGPDSDYDKLPDSYEALHSCLVQGMPDAHLDPDYDEATSFGEMALGTDPCVEDASHVPDDDGDGFSHGFELFLGTDPGDDCPDTSTANDEAPPDVWPFDFDDNQRAVLGDVLGYIPVFNHSCYSQSYDPRFDLNPYQGPDGFIGLGDVLSFIAVFNQSCAP